MYDIILFDFDGTVYDTLEGITKSVQYALNKQGIEAELKDLRCFAGPPLLDMFMEKYEFSEETAEKAVLDFRERYKPIGIYESRVFPGIPELLKKLKDRGKILGIATSKPQIMAEQLLEKEGIIEYFDAVCGSSPNGNNNSKREVLSCALKKLRKNNESAVLVGDTKYDVLGAHQCGVPCIGVEYGYGAEGELLKAGADIIAEDMDKLLEILIK